MKKATLYFVTISFGILLAGIILIQLYWLKTAMDLKEKQFDGQVYSLLQNVSKKVEERENAIIAGKSFAGDTTIITENIIGEDDPENTLSNARALIASGEEGEVILSNETGDENVSMNVNVSSDNKGAILKQRLLIKKPGKTVEIISNGNQTRWVEKKINNVKIIINKLIRSKTSQNASIISGESLEKILREELISGHINMNPEMALIQKDTINYTNTRDTIKLKESGYATNLYPNDLLGRKATLLVFFPGKLDFLLTDMLLPMLLALVFTLLLITIFFITAYNLNKQKKLNEVKSDFINNLMHELKTPLASIQLGSDMIYQNTDVLSPKEIGEISKTIKRQSIKMDNDIKNILQHALIENNGNVKNSFTKQEVVGVIDEALEEVKLLALVKNITIEKNDTVPEGVYIYADKDLLVKAIVNLLDNAIKYSFDNSTVKIVYEKERDEVKINVSDFGQGIKKEDLPFVFNTFYRGEKGNIHNTKGYGLGLSFVKKVADIHGGKVEVESITGRGSLFSFKLPVNTEQ